MNWSVALALYVGFAGLLVALGVKAKIIYDRAYREDHEPRVWRDILVGVTLAAVAFVVTYLEVAVF